MRKRLPEPPCGRPHTTGRGAFVKHGAQWGIRFVFEQGVNISRIEH